MSSETVTPVVGMGVTEQIGSDAYPWTIIEVSTSGKRLILQKDRTVRADKNGQSEAQTYLYIPDQKGEKVVVSLRNDGTWRQVGEKRIRGWRFFPGKRHHYSDPGF